ncbi:sphingosine kinase 1-like isoform X1 [Tachysurus vachellii]|uniref:sphingosine kinase 1-like isoform X1 n=2 Tax=Tachysurus vachellii TaxID=175792 RepID=UPI00296B302E|nr:sphingosine kinase 1-like isoform X1 [Tachysurus vachellii]
MDSVTPQPDHAVAALPMRGEFTGFSRFRCTLVLTECELTVQKLGTWGRKSGTVTVLDLQDCIGCRAYGAEDGQDTSAGLAVYFYPERRHCARLSCSAARRREELRFRVAVSPEPRVNLEEAQRWSRAIRHSSYLRTGGVCADMTSPRRFLVLINPQSGKGQALDLFNNHVKHMLQEANITYTLQVTERQNHARELVREADLSQWDAVVIMSGDGLLFEVVNGLMEREDWEKAIQTPLGVLPGGSGNALAASIHYYSGSKPVSGKELLVSCGFMLCKGLVSHLDLTSVCLASNQRLFSFLSLAWGFVADVDIESEKYRHMGAARFTMGTLVRLASLRVYKGKLAYLPAEESQAPSSSASSEVSFTDGSKSCLVHSSNSNCQDHCLHNSCNSNNAHNPNWADESPATSKGPADTLLVPLDQPVPTHWSVVKEEDFVLVMAVYQSHLAEDLIAAPASRLEDGTIHLMYVKAGISRQALLRLFLAMEKGTHLSKNCPFVVYVKVRALRLEPYAPKGIITVDGEVVEYGPVQAQVHGRLARIITG